MYNGIGLTTPRGSGTNGYVVRNLSFVKPPPTDRNKKFEDFSDTPKQRKANEAILEHDRKRKIEVKCMEYRVQLEDEELEEDIIEEKVQEFREKLLKEKVAETDAKDLKEHDTHQIAAAKEKANEKMKRALRIDKGYVEGAAFDQELQEKLREERRAKKARLAESNNSKRRRSTSSDSNEKRRRRD
ncbi:cwf21 domain-containing protein [Mycotypha africana]|uniref:cwf21 domain-containing protein n=1 Tax=Mycotypha africana TaxID=64632 RepID=UPI0023016205|nr:cwf21 domain-containing protein [Mycotypha africana]KAI8991434.1 cwf21 domain-containing protein [Mycotypha africana]